MRVHTHIYIYILFVSSLSLYTYIYIYIKYLYIIHHILKYMIARVPLDDSYLENRRSESTLRQSLEILDNAPTVHGRSRSVQHI